MFDKILIANRGEIACRIMRTAHQLGIATVAVYSDADAGAKHVVMATEAVRIGPAPVSESYLCGDAIIAAALAAGAQAVHPGYGFLSENPGFVEQVTAAGLRFIGPSADSIRAMGLKDAAKTLMQEAGVPVVPGYHGADQQLDLLAAEADRIGYPVLIKARAGGGGKGMRKVDSAADFAAALEGAMREGQASFGDPACLIEKYISSPRHIEIQVFGDDHGNVVHLFERDCSLQRRHQKVIEEAPAPGMTPEIRQAMGQAAVTACQAINYSGAGTIEFIVDSSAGLRPDRFWFMEMNTRLQVEHPVTEAITGQDLVAWQLKVASGEALPMTQEQLSINGWSMESRIYAEDVNNGFLPVTGTIDHLRFPAGVRVDSGVRQGDTITPFYDPMIAKVIVHADSRQSALAGMRRALQATQAAGTTTNINFLAALCAHRDFAAGAIDTGLIDRNLPQLIDTGSIPSPVLALAALGALGLYGDNPPHCGFSLWQPLVRQVVLEKPFAVDENNRVTAQVETLNGKSFNVHIDGVSHLLKLAEEGGDLLTIDGQLQRAGVVSTAGGISVFTERAYHFSVPDLLVADHNDGLASDSIVAPMPGQIKVIHVNAGDQVPAGAALLVMEAMKMEHTLYAPRDCAVEELLVGVDDQVEASALLLKLHDRQQG